MTGVKAELCCARFFNRQLIKEAKTYADRIEKYNILKHEQERLKLMNKICKFAKSKEEVKKRMQENGFTENQIYIAVYELDCNGTKAGLINFKSLQISYLKKIIELPIQNVPQQIHNFGNGIEVIADVLSKRIKIYFPKRPLYYQRKELVESGFKLDHADLSWWNDISFENLTIAINNVKKYIHETI